MSYQSNRKRERERERERDQGARQGGAMGHSTRSQKQTPPFRCWQTSSAPEFASFSLRVTARLFFQRSTHNIRVSLARISTNTHNSLPFSRTVQVAMALGDRDTEQTTVMSFHRLGDFVHDLPKQRRAEGRVRCAKTHREKGRNRSRSDSDKRTNPPLGHPSNGPLEPPRR